MSEIITPTTTPTTPPPTTTTTTLIMGFHDNTESSSVSKNNADDSKQGDAISESSSTDNTFIDTESGENPNPNSIPSSKTIMEDGQPCREQTQPQQQQQQQHAVLCSQQQHYLKKQEIHSRPWKRLSMAGDLFESTFEEDLAFTTTPSTPPTNSKIKNSHLLERQASSKHDLGRLDRIRVSSGSIPILLISIFIFIVFAGAGIAICLVIDQGRKGNMEDSAMALAVDTGKWFSDQLDQAILPLFSLAQFATHLDIFRDLPDKIGEVGRPGSLPFVNGTYNRNVTGVCDEPKLVSTFIDIAEGVKKSSGLDGIMVNVQMAPEGVVCLLYPMNNTEDFKDGQFLDNTGAWGLDLFHDPRFAFIALQSIKTDKVGIAGPMPLIQCPTCGPFFIARLPVEYDHHEIVVDGRGYPRWGFVTALISWTTLVDRSGIYESFARDNFDFKLTRTDRNLNVDTGEYEEKVVTLAETPNFEEKLKYRYTKTVSTTLETTNNLWEMTVSYTQKPGWIAAVCTVCVVASLCVSYLVHMVLSQKQVYTGMVADSRTHQAMVNTERNMTAYFAHELRNPLSALDSALRSLTDEDLPESTREVLQGMKLCSDFMASIMNNLLDVRKLEEGKMHIRPQPLSLSRLIQDSRLMMLNSVKQGVEFVVLCKVPKERNWVLGDAHRIQQVVANVVNNATKYTSHGSITLVVSWKDKFVQIECIDTGPGIPKSEQERLFERFVQRGGAPGTGLGLNIAKQIVTMMEGSIAFESDPTIKPGTTCRIQLPLVLCEEPEEISKQPARPIEEPIRVLIMDDIKMNRMMLERRIKKAIAPNATIVMAATGEEALEICNEQKFDIIICDQYLEEAGGVLLGTDVIIAMRRNRVDSIIIGCSGNDLEKEFMEAGTDLIWGKPMPKNEDIIEQWRDELLARRVTRVVKRIPSESELSR